MLRHHGIAMGTLINTMHYAIALASFRVLSFLLLPLLTSKISAEAYGRVDLAGAITTFLGTAIGLDLAGSLARVYWDTSRRENVVPTLMVCIIFGGCLGGFFVVVAKLNNFWPLTYSAKEVFNILLNAMLLGMNGVVDTFLRMKERKLLYAACGLIESAVTLSGTLLLVTYEFPPTMSYTASFGIGLFLHLVIALRAGQVKLFLKPDSQTLKRALNISLPVMPALILSWAGSNYARFVISSDVGFQAAAIYGAATRISGLVGIPIAGFNLGWVPRAMKMIATDDREMRHEITRTMNLYLLFGFAGCTLFSIAAKPIVRLASSPEYIDAAVLLPWLAIGMVVGGMGNIVNLNSYKNEKTLINSIAACAGLIVSLVVGLIGLGKLSVERLAIGYALGEYTKIMVLAVAVPRNTETSVDLRCLHVLLFAYSIIQISGILR